MDLTVSDLILKPFEQDWTFSKAGLKLPSFRFKHYPYIAFFASFDWILIELSGLTWVELLNFSEWGWTFIPQACETRLLYTAAKSPLKQSWIYCTLVIETATQPAMCVWFTQHRCSFAATSGLVNISALSPLRERQLSSTSFAFPLFWALLDTLYVSRWRFETLVEQRNVFAENA